MTRVRRSIEVAKAAAEICCEENMTELKSRKGVHTEIKGFVLTDIGSNRKIAVLIALEITVVVDRVGLFGSVIEKGNVGSGTEHEFGLLSYRRFENKIQRHVHIIDELRVGVCLYNSGRVVGGLIFSSLIIKVDAGLKIEFRFRSEP